VITHLVADFHVSLRIHIKTFVTYPDKRNAGTQKIFSSWDTILETTFSVPHVELNCSCHCAASLFIYLFFCISVTLVKTSETRNCPICVCLDCMY